MPEPAPAPCPETRRRRAPVWWRACCATGRTCRRVLKALLAVLLIGAYWIHFHGLPGPAIEALKRVAARQGLWLDAHALHFKWHRGLIASGVVLFNPEDRITPAVRVAELRFNPSVWAGLRRGEWLEALELNGTEIRDPVAVGDANAATITGLGLRMRYSASGFAFEQIRFLFHGLAVDGSGVLLARTGPGRPSASSAAVPSIRQIHQELKALDPVLRILSGIGFTQPPVIHVDFLVDENNPLRNHLDAVCSYADGASYRGLPFSSVEFRVEVRENLVRADPLSITVPGGFLRGSVVLDASGKLRNAEASVDLTPDYLGVLLPSDLLEDLEKQEIRLDGRVRGHLDYRRLLGPGGGRELQAEVALADASWRGIRLRDASARLQRTPAFFQAEVTRSRLGEGASAGPVSARVHFDRVSGRFEGEVKTGFAPREALPALRDDPDLMEIISRIEFKDRPGQSSFVFSGKARESAELVLDGAISGSNMVYRSVPFDQFSARLTVSNRNVRLASVEAVQSGLPLRGWLEIHRKPRRVDLDVQGGVHPAVLAHIIGSGVERHLARAVLLPPFAYSVSGSLDLASNAQHRVVAQIRAGGLGYGPHLLEQAEVFATLSGNLLTLPQVAGVLAGGRVQGMAQLAGLDHARTAMLYGDFGLDGVGLTEIATRLRGKPEEKQLGRVSGRISLEGRLGPDWQGTVLGAGELAVREGKLFEIAFFGGLSKVLSAIIPGFGYAEQTDLTTSFRIENRQVQLTDAKLLGNVISAFGSGHIGFDRTLGVKVQVKLMREGIIAKTLQIISWPITKLFEIKLIGTLDQPEWRPENLPKELFLKF